jgi:CRISPR/Cas system CSM-associated protein Csm3 (group 7 of RAMP superfamily)
MFDDERYYARVPIRRKRDTPPESDRTHQRLAVDNRYTGRITATLVAQQRLHVGSGVLVPPEKLGLTDTEAPLVKAFARQGEQRVIPGSSLKGAFRSLFELFTDSCVRVTREYSLRRDGCLYRSKRHRGQLCPACKLFGAMGYMGQVRFDDAFQVSGEAEAHRIPPQYQPRRDPHNRRYYPHALIDPRERTWPLEVIKPGAEFELVGQYTNLTKGELGLLLITLGQGEWQLCPKLGAGKSSGLGGIKVKDLSVKRMDPTQAYQAYDLTDAWESIAVEECLDAAAGRYREADLQRVAADLACEELKRG